MIRVENTELPGVKLILPPAAFEDFRGDFVETYNEASYRDAGITEHFVQDDYSTSSKHVLRGFHGDGRTTKLVSCIRGRVYFAVVNNDPASPAYRRWVSVTLSASNRLQVYVPPLHGAAFVVMSDEAIVHYKQTAYYERASQFEIKWNDPAFAVWWPIQQPITSQRDFA